MDSESLSNSFDLQRNFGNIGNDNRRSSVFGANIATLQAWETNLLKNEDIFEKLLEEKIKKL